MWLSVNKHTAAFDMIRFSIHFIWALLVCAICYTNIVEMYSTCYMNDLKPLMNIVAFNPHTLPCSTSCESQQTSAIRGGSSILPMHLHI